MPDYSHAFKFLRLIKNKFQMASVGRCAILIIFFPQTKILPTPDNCQDDITISLFLPPYLVVVAQLVRALDCGSRGRGFEPRLPPYTYPAFLRGIFLQDSFFLKILFLK